MRRAYFKCDNCDLHVHLLTPAERPCPSCGGNFIEIDEDEDTSQLDLGLFRFPALKEITETDVDELFREIDEYLFEKSQNG